MVCWEGTHLWMATIALFCLSIFLLQATLLPPGTFKETMMGDSGGEGKSDTALDILFVSCSARP